MMLFAGQVYRASVKVNSETEPLAATLLITAPDGTTEQVTGPWTWAEAPDGLSWTTTYDYPLAVTGRHELAWTIQGPGAAPRPEVLNVRRYLSILNMAETCEHLNEDPDDEEVTGELGRYLMAATELVESKVGICVTRQFTWRPASTGRAYEIVVPDRPLIKASLVASVWTGGPSWAEAVLGVDAEAGIIYQPSGMDFWWGPWDCTYTAGRPEIPEHFIQAGLEQVRHLWETQAGAQPPTVLQGEEVFTATTGFTFSVPRRVLELLEEDMVPST